MQRECVGISILWIALWWAGGAPRQEKMGLHALLHAANWLTTISISIECGHSDRILRETLKQCPIR